MVVLTADREYVGMMGELTERETNVPINISMVEKAMGIYKDKEGINITNGFVDFVNAGSSNILQDRILKKTGEELYIIVKELIDDAHDK